MLRLHCLRAGTSALRLRKYPSPFAPLAQRQRRARRRGGRRESVGGGVAARARCTSPALKLRLGGVSSLRPCGPVVCWHCLRRRDSSAAPGATPPPGTRGPGSPVALRGADLLVEQGSDLTGSTWTSKAQYLRAGGGYSSMPVRQRAYRLASVRTLTAFYGHFWPGEPLTLAIQTLTYACTASLKCRRSCAT